MMEPSILLDTWATTMWRACWQGGLVVLVVWSICRLLPSMPARFQCWLWRLAILKFMVVLVKGHYALSSRANASLCLFQTVTKGSGKGPIRPGQRLAVAKGEADYELSETLEQDG